MTLNCKICQSSLEINETGKAVFCPKCDRNHQKKTLGGLLGAIKQQEMIGNMEGILPEHILSADQITKLWLEARKKQIDQNIDEVTIQYHCIRCERPTNQYGWCLWCEDELRETL